MEHFDVNFAFLYGLGGLALGIGVHWTWIRLRSAKTGADDGVALAPDERMQLMLDRFNVAIETAGFSPWEIDARNGRIVWAENRIRAFGLSELPLDEYGQALSKMMHPDDYAEMLGTARAAIAGQDTGYSYRYRLVRPDGLVRHMQSHVRIVRNGEGAAVRLLGATTDITNEVQTNELLLRQAEQERLLLDRLNIATQAAGISSWEIDLRERRFLWIENPIEGFEVAESEYALDVFFERIHPDDRAVVLEQVQLARSRGQDRVSYRFRTFNPEQRLIHVQVNARMLFDEGGRVARLLGVSWDVTKEVEAAAQLKEQAAHERMLLDRLAMSTQAAGISSWEYDFEAQCFLWIENPITALNGPDGIWGGARTFLERVHAQDRHAVEQALRLATTERRDRVSFRYRGAGPFSETDVHLQTHARVLYDDAGHPRRMLGISWDITKEIFAQQQLELQALQLRDAERRLERASLSSSEGHWELDLRSWQMWLSSSYQALLGYREGELPGDYESLRELVHPDDASRCDQVLHRHLNQGDVYDVELRVRTASGEYRWFRRRGTADRDAQGRPVLMSGSIHDIHQRKLAEDALRLAQLRFERAIHGTQDGLWELEANGTAWCSPRLGELLGFEPGEFAAETNFLRQFLHADDESTVAAATQAHFQLEAPYDIEIRLRTKAGEYRWYRARATAERDSTGRPLRLSGSLQDVTDARAARDALLSATEAAESANRAKSEFLANVSHEIRTPMNGIIGMTGLLLDTALDRTQRDYAETIRGSADSLLIVINDILDFSKIEAGKLDIETIEVDLRSAVEDVGGAMAFQAAARNLELIVHVHPQVPAHVMGDSQRLRQCLINLVGNAIKFTRKGEIVIEVSVAGRRDGKVLTHFEVRDTGIGIAPSVLQTLFQPFVQADSSTTRHFGGTGLGLSIVRRLVEMMGGEVGVESEIGQGSTFWFVLPLEPAVANTVSVPLDLERLGRRILVVDDHETNRRVLAGQLMHAGYEVSLASGGEEALRMLQQARKDSHPFEVVLADYRMHDMDGAALGERINNDPELSQARVIVLTSLDRHGDMRRFASLGFAGYLTKPVKARELLECIDRVLSRDAKEWHLRSQPIVTRGTLAGGDARRYEGHVLLVEDNPVNQKVAVRFLERMGCKVRVADNGAEGVKAWQEARFDIVLMDLQMPVMDGLTATRRIRELEATSGQIGTPIVALTANAMAGQLEICMEAGMSGFLTKPLEIARLHETLDRYGLGIPPEAMATAAHGVAAQTPVDLARLNELTDGDPEFAHELANTFISSGEQVLKEIHEALASFDRSALTRAGHKLKGASANIYAEALRALAYELETSGANIDQPRLKELVLTLDLEFQRAAQFLTSQAPGLEKKAG
jgi:PAS domain S-box-containing protein